MSELKALQTVRKYSNFLELCDYFEEGGSIYILTRHPKRTLLEHVSSSGRSSMPEKQVNFLVKNIASGLKKLHSKNIVHRGLSLETVGVNVKRDRVKVQIGSFDLAICLKQGQPAMTQAITRTLNSGNKLAPEVEAGKAHNAAADVWALGQILYKLLFALDSDASSDTLAVSFNAGMTAEDEIAMLMESCGNTLW